MLFHSYLARPVLLLVVVGLGAAVGCQQQPAATDQKGDQGAKIKQVTVAVTGMT